MEQEPTLASQRVKHLGIFRTGITVSEARLDKAILKMLFRRFFYRGAGEGQLASYVNTKKTDPKFQASLARLAEWRMIEFGPAVHEDARTVLLAPNGRGWAEELCYAVQAGSDTDTNV